MATRGRAHHAGTDRHPGRGAEIRGLAPAPRLGVREGSGRGGAVGVPRRPSGRSAGRLSGRPQGRGGAVGGGGRGAMRPEARGATR